MTTLNLKYHLQLGMTNSICLMDPILYLTYKIVVKTLLKKRHQTVPDNSPIQIYINKIKYCVVFKIKNIYNSYK